MKKMLVALLLPAACAAPACQVDQEDAKRMTRDPEKLHAWFMEQIRSGQYAQAYNDGLSPETQRALGGEYVQSVFYHVIQWEIVRRILLGFEQREVSFDKESRSGAVTWRHPQLGITRRYRLVAVKIGRTKIFWRYEFTREEIEELRTLAEAWFRKQKEAADNRLYTYPPDWHYTPLEGEGGDVP